jgi:small-conductance mechanosensitive channel
MQNASTEGAGAGHAWLHLQAYLNSLGAPALAINAGLSVLLILGALIGSVVLSRITRVMVRRLLLAIAIERPALLETPRALLRLIQVGVWTIALAFLVTIWGFDVLAWRGGELFVGVLRLLAILIVAVATWEVGGLLLGAAFRRAAAKSDTARRAAQLRSLEPMSRGALQGIVAVFAAMLVVSELGVEIGPLLAGAGVVGIAVGFGAQTLVKDYLTGFSLILEDIVSVGDIARIGDSGGLVETMTLRTIRLRDFDGTLHVIPYSEAQVVHNLTKTFSYYVFDLPISYDSNIDQALSLMRAVGAEMSSDPQFRTAILEPIEVVGVDRLADSGVVLKARIKTQPIKQWNVGREYNRRIKLAFDKAGVEIPVPHLKLMLPERTLDAVKASFGR